MSVRATSTCRRTHGDTRRRADTSCGPGDGRRSENGHRPCQLAAGDFMQIVDFNSCLTSITSVY
jgi:hypothetical protein